MKFDPSGVRLAMSLPSVVPNGELIMSNSQNGELSGPVTVKRLGTKEDVAKMCSMAPRTVLRNADRGAMPWGLKIGSLRRWDLDEIAEWISSGCKPVRSASKGGAK